jgi:hypothetical protein
VPREAPGKTLLDGGAGVRYAFGHLMDNNCPSEERSGRKGRPYTRNERRQFTAAAS